MNVKAKHGNVDHVICPFLKDPCIALQLFMILCINSS